MADTMRKITRLQGAIEDRAVVGPRPDFDWIPLDRLRVNDQYQRQIGKRSITLIRALVRGFDWTHVRPATVTPTGDGNFEILDGQHLATAAATHGSIPAIPCFIVTTETAQQRAAAFVGLNRDRVAMTSLQIFYADLLAGDDVANAAQDGVTLAGGRVLRAPPPAGRYVIGDTVSPLAIRKVAKAKGKAGVRRIFRIAIDARRAPVGAVLISALARLLWTRTYHNPRPSDLAISSFLLSVDQASLELIARNRAKESGKPTMRILADAIYQGSLQQ